MTILNSIAKRIRQTIGVLTTKDPEVERVVAALMDRMMDHDKWARKDSYSIVHKEFNIVVSRHAISEPDYVWIPYRLKSHVQEHINIVLRTHEVNRLGFIHDVVSGKYVYQVRTSALTGTEYKEWLAENVKSDEYIIKDYWIYFLNEETAMGFKLAMQ